MRPGEGRLVAPSMVVALLVVASQVLAVIVSDTVFVTAFDLGQLSGFIVVAAIARVILTLGYGAVARWAHPGPMRGLALGIVGAMTCGLALVLRGSSPTVVYAGCTALLAVPVAAQEAVSVSTEAFPARQGKRLVPLVAASSSIGGMIAGVFARGLSVRMGAPNLLWIAGALLVVAGLVSRVRSSAVEAHEVESGGAHPHLAFQELRTLPIVRVAVALALLVAVTNSVSDFAFKATLKSAFARDQMAAFVGVFEAALSASVIVAQLFLTARLGRTRRSPRDHHLVCHPDRPASPLAAPGVRGGLKRVAMATAVKLAESLTRFSGLRTRRCVPSSSPPWRRATWRARACSCAAWPKVCSAA